MYLAGVSVRRVEDITVALWGSAEEGVEKKLTHCDLPSEHWTRIHTNQWIERLNRGSRRTRMAGSFPDD